MARRSFDFRPRSILCAVDFSAQSATALRHAAALVRGPRTRVTALFVTDPLFIATAPSAADPRELIRIATRQLRAFVRGALSPGRSKSIRFLVARGKPWREILKTAERLRSDVVVVGTEGLGGTGSLFFGSTTEKVLRRATVPVLAVPGTEGRRATAPARGWPGKWVVAPNDLGTGAEAEAQRAAAVARALGAGLILVHVIPTLQIPAWSRADLDAHYRGAIAIAQEWLDELRSKAGEDIATEARVEIGNPADAIAALAAARRSGLVVLTLRGRGGSPAWRPDVIAARVLSQSAVPVLVLPPRQRRTPTAGR